MSICISGRYGTHGNPPIKSSDVHYIMSGVRCCQSTWRFFTFELPLVCQPSKRKLTPPRSHKRPYHYFGFYAWALRRVSCDPKQHMAPVFIKGVVNLAEGKRQSSCPAHFGQQGSIRND